MSATMHHAQLLAIGLVVSMTILLFAIIASVIRLVFDRPNPSEKGQK